MEVQLPLQETVNRLVQNYSQAMAVLSQQHAETVARLTLSEETCAQLQARLEELEKGPSDAG